MGNGAKIWFLIAASFVFYGVHTAWYALLLAGSIFVNYILGEYLLRRKKQLVLATGITANLLLLGYFKYLHFFGNEVSRYFDLQFSFASVALPIAISFFTFQQIAYIVDSYRGTRPNNTFSEYALFVSFFPQLIAGPIVRQQHVVPQFAAGRLGITTHSLAFGLSIFAMGLAKKLFLADSFAAIADPVFGEVAKNGAVSFVSAWGGILAYTLQIYFDFSAYSDMAIGLAAIFGIALPLNFLSPYKATSPSDFWKRWHITLSEFLQYYLYIPLGGNRVPAYRVAINLMIVMALGGLWHGAGWSFLLWGVLHGLYLVGYHLLRGRLPSVDYRIAIAVTFFLVVIAWVPFRAEDSDVIAYYGSLFAVLGGDDVPINWIAILTGLAICWLLPNTAQVFGLAPGARLHWKPSASWAFGFGAAAFGAIIVMMESEPYEFIYFQF